MDDVCSSSGGDNGDGDCKEFNREPDCCASLGELKPSIDRTIFYQIPLTSNNGPPKPHPERFVYNWSPTASSWVLSTSYSSLAIPSTSTPRDFVKMPFTVDSQSKHKLTKTSQWSKTVSLLTESNIRTIDDLIIIIKDYNPSMRNQNFNVLAALINECYTPSERESFFSTILPQMIKLAVDLPKLIRQPIPILKQGFNHSLFFSQQQLSSLLCNGFFCTFPEHKQNKLQDFSFSKLLSCPLNDEYFNRKLEKLKCIVNYLHRVVKDTPRGIVSFERRNLRENEIINWSTSTFSLSKMCVQIKGTIESHGYGMLQADFANRYVGGGVLRAGLVQEEIRFVINPELIASMLFTESLLENEVLLITGTEQFNKYSGYANSFLFDGNYFDPTPLDEWGRRYTKIVAMDATFFADKVRTQYKKGYIDRELIKAYAAFMERRKLEPKHRCAIATGNWGCGVYRGDPQLKSLIQLIAASLSEKDIVYFTFGDAKLSSEMNLIVNNLRCKNVTTGQLYQFLLDYGDYVTSLDLDQEKEPLFDYIERKFLTPITIN